MNTESPQQEWTPEWLAHFGKANDWLESICNAHNAALTAERKRREQLEAKKDEYKLANLEMANALLHEHAAEVRKPLVDAIRFLREGFRPILAR